MNHKTSLIASVMLAMSVNLSAQTICNADGTVTFQYKNDKAKEVQVDVQFAGRNPMKKDAKTGLWTATLGPAAPDMYPYCFIVDGVSVMDPLCDQYFPNEGFKNSLLEIPAKQGNLPHDIRANVPHGRVEYIHYYSEPLGGVNSAIVYTPAGYDKNTQKKYPVFYLISGTTDTEEVYYKVGRMNYILDNLVAQGKAQEMIIVLPYGNPTKLLNNIIPDVSDAEKGNRLRGNGGFGGGMPGGMRPGGMGGGMPMFRDVVSEDITGDLMRYVESHYRTINDADHRAIGGFSRGGNQGLGIGLRNLDKFSYLCSYSSFTSTDIPGVYDNPAQTNKKINLFWLGVGTDDFLFGNARDYMQHLDDHGITAVKEYTHDKFGHTWMNAKYFLSKTLPLLFNKEASRKAMEAATPTLAKTGQEAQFTASTMATLFPRQVTSPEWHETGVVLRLNAPDAKEVRVEFDDSKPALSMGKDADGVWTCDIKEKHAVCKYRFVVDGTPIADPTNMYLAPDKSFKWSVLTDPRDEGDLQKLGNIRFGKVSYDLNTQSATYLPSDVASLDAARKAGLRVIQVVPGKADTMESWFKVGQAHLIADRLIATGTIKPVIITTQQVKGATVIKADAYKSWEERREALRKALQK